MPNFYIKPKWASGENFKDFYADWGVKILSVKGYNDEKPKDYYKVSWPEEHGLDVYVPNDRKVSEVGVEIRGFCLGAAALTNIETMKAYLRGNGVLTYWDDFRGISFDVVYEGYTLESDRLRGDSQFVVFKLNFTKNINEAIDSSFLDDYTEEDLEQLKEDILNAANIALDSSSEAIAAKILALAAAQACNDATSEAMAAAALANSVGTHPPRIISDYWWYWNISTEQYVSTGIPARGIAGHSPQIINGYWWTYNTSSGLYENTGQLAVMPLPTYTFELDEATGELTLEIT